MARHVFVVMPFGIKKVPGAGGKTSSVNFDQVYLELIQPALPEPEYTVFRADDEDRAGNIREDMFQELLLADLVIADISIDNPNVWYELGVRHALRSRGIILLSHRQGKTPFDILTDRQLRYELKNGSLVKARLPMQREALKEMIEATITAPRQRKVSPVYRLLPYLNEPDWKSLRVGGALSFWEDYDAWARRVTVAQRRNRPGDILVLAEDTPTQVLQLEAYRTAGDALMKLEQFRFAREQYRKALKIDPDDLPAGRKLSVVQGRMGKPHLAKETLNALAAKNPDDPETLALLGRVEKDRWVAAWMDEKRDASARRTRAHDHVGLLREAINAYSSAFRKDPSHYYSGINAVGLMHVYKNLTGEELDAGQRRLMEGGVEWSVAAALDRETSRARDYWARVTRGDLLLYQGRSNDMLEAYRDAIAVAEGDWFSLNSSLQQLELLAAVGFHTRRVGTAVRLFRQASDAVKPRAVPDRVYLFSGHMIDAPDREQERFPPDMEDLVTEAIATELDDSHAGPGDRGICGGACGGDLIFAEACLQRGLRLEIRLAFNEPKHLRKSVVLPGSGDWRRRFNSVREHPNTKVFVLEEDLGPSASDDKAFERSNLWMLYSALCWGFDKIQFISLWNGEGGDGPGGTRHMNEEVSRRSGASTIIDARAILGETRRRREV